MFLIYKSSRTFVSYKQKFYNGIFLFHLLSTETVFWSLNKPHHSNCTKYSNKELVFYACVFMMSVVTKLGNLYIDVPNKNLKHGKFRDDHSLQNLFSNYLFINSCD